MDKIQKTNTNPTLPGANIFRTTSYLSKVEFGFEYDKTLTEIKKDIRKSARR